jgi:redox-sensitive bicupin YhaK (pirin superfamily)
MSSIKSIKSLSFPWQTQDPFIFCVYHRDLYPKGNGKMGPSVPLSGRNLGQDFEGKDGWSMYHGTKVPGFPAHPHCGFETVTVVQEGLVDHSDSLGAAGRFGNGDVQWMTAGKGVQHSEMFPLLHTDKNNPLLLFQIWLNLPKAKKRANPHFAMLWEDTIPKIEKTDSNGNKTEITLIAGKIDGVSAPKPAPDSWAADPNNEVMIAVIKMDPKAEWSLPMASQRINRSLYFFKGSACTIDEQSLNTGKAVELNAHLETVLKNGSSEGHFLILQGRPINEPVVQYGPFVTNSNQEVQQVMQEFQRTQFGGWPWPAYDHTHEVRRGRFALHADGKLEEKH